MIFEKGPQFPLIGEKLFGCQPSACAPATESSAVDPEAMFQRENVNGNIYIFGGNENENIYILNTPQPIRPKFQK